MAMYPRFGKYFITQRMFPLGDLSEKRKSKRSSFARPAYYSWRLPREDAYGDRRAGENRDGATSSRRSAGIGRNGEDHGESPQVGYGTASSFGTVARQPSEEAS